MEKQYSVLVAEDEPLLRQYLQSSLTDIHPSFTVSNAVRDGLAALEAVKSEHFDLLITDIKMPGLDGISLISRLRADGNNIPVIILSGYGDFEYARAGLRYGVSEYILKPLNDAELQNVLNGIAAQLDSAHSRVELPDDWSPDNIRLFISKCFSVGSPEQSQLVECAAAYITAHYTEPITQSSVAQELGITPAYLSNIFHEAKGESYSQFLTRLRMTQAALLLKTNPSLTVQSVAELTGYVSDKHFISVFKKFFNFTPNEYRKK